MSENPVKSTDSSPWALVTGASAGIGEEFCRQLAARGYNLVLVARRAERLHALSTELQQEFGTACLILPADLSDSAAAEHIAQCLAKEEIEVEFLVNNAGYGLAGRFTDPDWSEHQDFIQVMMTVICELCWRLLPAMQARKRGFIVNVASVAGLVPGSEGHTLYGASKSFLIRFSEVLALENRWHNVKVSALCPGFTYSEFHDVSGTRELVRQLPGYMWLSAKEVVQYGIDSVMRDKPRVQAIPGFFYRMSVNLVRYVPGLGSYLVNKMSGRFRKLD